MNKDITENAEKIDLNAQKREALKKLDNAKFGWFHVKAIMVSGVGFFTVFIH